MNSQQADLVKFSEEFEQRQQIEGGSSSSTQIRSSSTIMATSPVPSSANQSSDVHITQRASQIHCITPFSELKVLCELIVDFKNIQENGLDLFEELVPQGWENYFGRLQGPVYENLVKDFWRKADCDDLYIVSDVLGQRIVITEKSISDLLGMKFLEGRRIYGMDNKSKFVKEVINPAIFNAATSEKADYKSKDLPDKLRVWHKIILGCINPRPPTSSSDYCNANQKYMLFYLQKHQPMCLPSLLFYYLRDSITKTRTTSDQSKKVPNYIPFGRLLSDIFVESGLVKFLEEAGMTEDLKVISGDVLNARSLKHMKLIQKVAVNPTLESSEAIINRRVEVDNFPLFSKLDPPEVIAEYVAMMEEAGIDMSGFSYEALPDAPPEMFDSSRSKRKKRSEASDEEKKKKKKHKRDSSRSSHSERKKSKSSASVISASMSLPLTIDTSSISLSTPNTSSFSSLPISLPQNTEPIFTSTIISTISEPTSLPLSTSFSLPSFSVSEPLIVSDSALTISDYSPPHGS